MALTIMLADVVTMDILVNALAYVIGIGFIVFLFVMIIMSILRDRRYERQTRIINELYEKHKRNPQKADHELHP